MNSRQDVTNMHTIIESNYNLLITGVTGLIGRHVLYEFMKQFMDYDSSGKIYVLMRQKSGNSVMERFKNIIECQYLPDYLKEYNRDDLLSKVEIIECDLKDQDIEEKLTLSIAKDKKLYVIHSAGSVNLFRDENAEKEVIENNFYGTQKLMRSLESYSHKFIFISTVFSCGKVNGLIGNDYASYYDHNRFRNPYEQYKNTLEKMIINQYRNSKYEYQILRPSIVVGRLVDKPLYFTSKFDVIYGWTKYFWNIKEKQGESNDVVRLEIDSQSQVNVVPVDYVAKSIVRVFNQDITSLNLVYPKCINNRMLYSKLLEYIGFNKYKFVDSAPTKFNKNEKYYYRFLAPVFNPYINGINNEYDTVYLDEIMSDVQVEELDLYNLFKFAVENEFNDEKVS